MIGKVLVALCSILSASAVAAQEPVESFAALPTYSEPMLSPDGEYVATKMAGRGKQVIAILSLFDPSAPPVIVDLSDLDTFRWWWINDEWLVVRVGAALKINGNARVNNVYATRLISVSRKSGKVNRLAWEGAGRSADEVLWKARDGGTHIRLERSRGYRGGWDEWPEVLDVDVATGQSRRVVSSSSQIIHYYADGKGAIRAAYDLSFTEHRGRLLYREGDARPFEITQRAKLDQHEALITPIVFLATPGQAIVSSSRSGAEALYRYDIVNQSFGEPVFAAAGYDIDEAVVNEAGDGLLGVYVIEDRPVTHWIDPLFAEAQANLDKAVGTGSARIISWSTDRQLMMVHVGAADQAGGYYLFSPLQGRLQRFGWVDEAFADRHFHPVRTIRFKARDGLEISAVLTLPKGKSGSLPLIVFPHGGPSARDNESWDWIAQFLADRGYAVIQPNYRGSTGFGAAFENAALGQWGLAMQDDLLDAIGYLAKQGIADPGRVCILGLSYGGYAALRGADRDGGAYRCAISYAGISDLKALQFDVDGVFTLSSSARQTFMRQYLEEHAVNLSAVSPINHVQNLNIPLLLMHGRRDLTVPIAQTRLLVDKLRTSKRTPRYVEQPDADHNFSREADRLQFLRELESFLKEHNPA